MEKMNESIYRGMGYESYLKVFGVEGGATDLLKVLLYGLVVFALWLIISSHYRRRNLQYKSREIYFFLVCILIIVLARVTSLYVDIWNPDEAHILISSLNLKWDHRLWVAMDSTTLGPLNYLLPALLATVLMPFTGGYEITLFIGRLCSMLLLIGAVFFLHRVAIRRVPQHFARLLTFVVVIYFSFSWNFEIQAYNSEYLFLFFCSAYLFVLMKIEEKCNASYIVVTGLLIGLFPFIKLQVLPMAAILGLWTIYLILKTIGVNKSDSLPVQREGVKMAVKYMAAAFLPTVLLLGYLSTYDDGLSQANLFYLKNAFAHSTLPILSRQFIDRSIVTLGDFYSWPWLGVLFNAAVCIFAVMVIYATLSKRDSSNLTRMKVLGSAWWFSLAFLLAALFAILRPGSGFGHYILFLVVPAFYFGLQTLHVMDRWLSAESMRLIFAGALFWFISSFWAAPGNLSEAIKKIKIIEAERGAVNFSQTPESQLISLIMDKTKPDDSIVVWGWEARINLYTQRRSATAQSDIQRLVNQHYPKENTSIYIADILRNKPKLIVDVVAPGSFAYTDAEKHGIHTHDQIYTVISDSYLLTDIIPVQRADKVGSYRVYTRID